MWVQFIKLTLRTVLAVNCCENFFVWNQYTEFQKNTAILIHHESNKFCRITLVAIGHSISLVIF